MSAGFGQAVASGDGARVTELLAAGHAANEPLDAIGTTPLMAAGTLDVLDILLEAGASTESTVFGRDVLQVVVSDENSALEPADRLAAGRRVIAAGASLDRNGDGWSRLYLAAFANDVAAVDNLLALGADPNDEPPPLAAACWGTGGPDGESGPIVDLLVDAGADVHVRDGATWSLLHAAAMPYSHGDGFTSSDGPNVAAMRALIRHGVAADAAGPDGVTALMLVAGAGAPDAIDALLAAGADPTVSDDQGRSALDHARDSAQLLSKVLAQASPEHAGAVRAYLDRAKLCIHRLTAL